MLPGELCSAEARCLLPPALPAAAAGGSREAGDAGAAGGAVLSALVALAGEAPVCRWVAEPSPLFSLCLCLALCCCPRTRPPTCCQPNQPRGVDLLFLCRERRGKGWFSRFKPWCLKTLYLSSRRGRGRAEKGIICSAAHDVPVARQLGSSCEGAPHVAPFCSVCRSPSQEGSVSLFGEDLQGAWHCAP